MMKLYSIYNDLEEIFNMPFCAKNDKMAMFLFDNWKKSIPEDKKYLVDASRLFCLGTSFNTATGVLSIDDTSSIIKEIKIDD